MKRESQLHLPYSPFVCGFSTFFHDYSDSSVTANLSGNNRRVSGDLRAMRFSKPLALSTTAVTPVYSAQLFTKPLPRGHLLSSQMPSRP